jgi:hypothetical protein
MWDKPDSMPSRRVETLLILYATQIMIYVVEKVHFA